MNIHTRDEDRTQFLGQKHQCFYRLCFCPDYLSISLSWLITSSLCLPAKVMQVNVLDSNPIEHWDKSLVKVIYLRSEDRGKEDGGKLTNKACGIKQITPVGKWSLILLGNSRRQCRLEPQRLPIWGVRVWGIDINYHLPLAEGCSRGDRVTDTSGLPCRQQSDSALQRKSFGNGVQEQTAGIEPVCTEVVRAKSHRQGTGGICFPKDPECSYYNNQRLGCLRSPSMQKDLHFSGTGCLTNTGHVHSLRKAILFSWQVGENWQRPKTHPQRCIYLSTSTWRKGIQCGIIHVNYLQRWLKASLVCGWRPESIWLFGGPRGEGMPRKGWPRGRTGICFAPERPFPFFLFSVNAAGHRGVIMGSRVEMKAPLSDGGETETRGSWYPWISSSAQTPGSSLKDSISSKFAESWEHLKSASSPKTRTLFSFAAHPHPPPPSGRFISALVANPYPYGQSGLHPPHSYGGGGELRMTVSDLLLIYGSPCQSFIPEFLNWQTFSELDFFIWLIYEP